MHEITVDVGPTSSATHVSKAPATVSPCWACCLSSRMAALVRMQRSTFAWATTGAPPQKNPGLFYLSLHASEARARSAIQSLAYSRISSRLVAVKSLAGLPESLP